MSFWPSRLHKIDDSIISGSNRPAGGHYVETDVSKLAIVMAMLKEKKKKKNLQKKTTRIKRTRYHVQFALCFYILRRLRFALCFYYEHKME